MSPATLTPPVVELPPRTPASEPAPPRLPQPVPLRRGRSWGGGPRLTRNAVAVSLAVHAILAVVLVWGIDEVVRRDASNAAASSGPREQVSYLDLGQWPGSTPGGGSGQAGVSTAAQAVTAGAIDSILARLPAAAPRFPTRTPTGLPPVPARGAQPGAPGAVPAVPGAPGAAGAAPGGAGNAIGGDVAGGRYGPGYGDRRLVVTPQAVPERQRTEHERYMDELAGRLGSWNDSVAEGAEHQRRLHNWTVKDRNGREWGIGEGGVPVIAGHRIPVPLSPPIYRGRDREDAERTANRQDAEIARQAEDMDRDRNFRDRVRATRARTDSVRRIRRAATSDTTKSQ